MESIIIHVKNEGICCLIDPAQRRALTYCFTLPIFRLGWPRFFYQEAEPFLEPKKGSIAMTNDHQPTDIQALGQAVAGLNEALARSEKRYSHLARIVRWSMLGIVSLLAFAGFMIADQTGIAFAQKDVGSFPQATTAVDALNNINGNLMVLGAVGKSLNEFMPAIKQGIMQNKDVQQTVQNYFKENNLDPTPEQQEAIAMKLIVERAVGTFVDAFVLMQRIRQDSDAFRAAVIGPEEALEGIGKELNLMNGALSAVPAMAAQMDLMNRNISSMSYSMGSTMGRMGNWMPW